MINSVAENRLVFDEVKFSSREIPSNITGSHPILDDGILLDVDQSDFNVLNSVLASIVMSDPDFKEINYHEILCDLFNLQDGSLHNLNIQEWIDLLTAYLSNINIKNPSFLFINSNTEMIFYHTVHSENNKENIFIILKDRSKYNAIYFDDLDKRKIIFDDVKSRIV